MTKTVSVVSINNANAYPGHNSLSPSFTSDHVFLKPHRTMAANMSQSEEIVLSDKTVSQMMAEKAVQDQTFTDLLSKFVGSIGNGRSKPKKFNAIVSVISQFRDQIADQMELRAPIPLGGGGKPGNLNTYLKQTVMSRVLFSKTATQKEGNEAASGQTEYKWGWVVSHQVCSKGLPKLTLDPGTADMHCTLGFCILAVHAPFPGRSYAFSL